MTSLETKASFTELLPCQVSVLVDSKLHSTGLFSRFDTFYYMHQRLQSSFVPIPCRSDPQSCAFL